MKINHYLTMSSMLVAMLGASADVLANGEPMYHFLPSDTVIDNVKSNLQNHGVDVSVIQVDADAQGVVQLSGEVASKQDVEAVTQLAKSSEGVYAVLGSLRYGTAEPVAAPVPEGLDPVLDSQPAAAGPEATDMQ